MKLVTQAARSVAKASHAGVNYARKVPPRAAFAVGGGIALYLVSREFIKLWGPTPMSANVPPRVDPRIAPAIWVLLANVNARWPQRSKAADGILPSAAHTAQNPNSDHETGAALDITLDEDNGPDLDDLAGELLKDKRVKYVIFNKRIANPDIQAGAWRPYTGVNPHDHHIHVSVKADKRNDMSHWNLAQVNS